MSEPTHMRKRPTSEAVWHWRWQRISAVALIFLLCWLMVCIVTHLQTVDRAGVIAWLSDVKVAIAAAGLVLMALVHKHIGIHEILLDYIHCPTKQKFFHFLLDAVSLVLGIATLAAIWHLHLLGMHA